MKTSGDRGDHEIQSKPKSVKINKMSDDAIFLSRLKLLIIMAKAYLIGCPLGKFRKQAVIENANQVFYHSLHLLDESIPLIFSNNHVPINIAARKKSLETHKFRQSVQLLSVMIRSVAEDHPMNHSRKKVLSDNLNKLSEMLVFNFQINNADFLKVA